MTKTSRPPPRRPAAGHGHPSRSSPAFGPASIEGSYDDAFAVPGLLERIREGEAAGAPMHMSSPASTTPGLTRRGRWPMRRWWASAKPDFILPACSPSLCGRDHAVALGAGDGAQPTALWPRPPMRAGARRRVAVLELDNPASNARAKIGDEIARALEEDGADAIVLGCAGHGGPRGLAVERIRRAGSRRCRRGGGAGRRSCGDRLSGPRSAAASHGRSRRPIPACLRRSRPKREPSATSALPQILWAFPLPYRQAVPNATSPRCAGLNAAGRGWHSP